MQLASARALRLIGSGNNRIEFFKMKYPLSPLQKRFVTDNIYIYLHKTWLSRNRI